MPSAAYDTHGATLMSEQCRVHVTVLPMTCMCLPSCRVTKPSCYRTVAECDSCGLAIMPKWCSLLISAQSAALAFLTQLCSALQACLCVLGCADHVQTHSNRWCQSAPTVHACKPEVLMSHSWIVKACITITHRHIVHHSSNVAVAMQEEHDDFAASFTQGLPAQRLRLFVLPSGPNRPRYLEHTHASCTKCLFACTTVTKCTCVRFANAGLGHT